VAEARLAVVEGPDAGKEFELSGTMTVGREGDIVIEDPEISRRHASLSWDGSALTVQDLGSTNGTFVNGERIQLRTLRAGDRVAFGKTEMTVETEAPR
jgi:pSer/pThr/pTyr-binding forkhead associated (FHA) protein